MGLKFWGLGLGAWAVAWGFLAWSGLGGPSWAGHVGLFLSILTALICLWAYAHEGTSTKD